MKFKGTSYKDMYYDDECPSGTLYFLSDSVSKDIMNQKQAKVINKVSKVLGLDPKRLKKAFLVQNDDNRHRWVNEMKLKIKVLKELAAKEDDRTALPSTTP